MEYKLFKRSDLKEGDIIIGNEFLYIIGRVLILNGAKEIEILNSTKGGVVGFTFSILFMNENGLVKLLK